jgi:predicted NAD-dependent protein-ADP-ribosyltransferase YbiA (DUF1768 family)
VEHYLQASKFANPEIQEEIRSAKTIRAVLKRSYGLGISYVPDWFARYPGRMRTAVEAKVQAHADIRRLLCSTDKRPLMHVSYKPNRDGCEVVDQNALGLILMNIRERLL